MTRFVRIIFLLAKVPKKEQMPITQVLTLPSNLLFPTDMFTFDSRLRYTHTYNVENVQKNTFNFKKKKKRDQFMESKNNISK
jgi:hypothetical protein